MTPSERADILDKAAAYINEHGWHQGDFADVYDAETPKCCAAGAIAKVQLGRPGEVVGDNSAVIDLTTFIGRSLRQVCRMRHRLPNGNSSEGVQGRNNTRALHHTIGVTIMSIESRVLYHARWRENDGSVDPEYTCRRCGAYVDINFTGEHDLFHERLGDDVEIES